MTIIWTILLGLVAGVLAMFAVYRSLPQDAWGWIGALLVGMVGGWLGGLLFRLLGLEAFNWIGALVVAFVGAAVLLWFLRRMDPQQRANRVGR